MGTGASIVMSRSRSAQLPKRQLSRTHGCGHQRESGRPVCRFCHNLYQAVWVGMRYWFLRVIVGCSNPESRAIAAGLSVEAWRCAQRCAMRGWRRTLAGRLRAQGLPSLHVRAAVHGRTVAKEITSSRMASRVQRARWGGHPRAGSVAWRRRELTRYLRREGLEDLVAEVL